MFFSFPIQLSPGGSQHQQLHCQPSKNDTSKALKIDADWADFSILEKYIISEVLLET